MRIGIDARELRSGATGVGRYLSGLLDEWASDPAARSHEFVLYAPDAIRVPGAPHFTTRLVPGSGGTWWEQVPLATAAAADRLDVFFAPGYSVPLALRVPRVVAIHDASFAAHPEWFRQREGMRRRWLARQSASIAHAVITISEFSRREIQEHLGVDDRRIRVIRPGVMTIARPALPSSQPNVLYVGSIFNRRHVPDLIAAFARLVRRHQDARLALVGRNLTYPYQDIEQAIARSDLGEYVHLAAAVSDNELQSLYSSARAFVFLSEYEGLGLTPLEALSAGVPSLLLDTPVARESCQDAAVYVPLGQLSRVDAVLERLLFDEQLRATLLGAAPRVLARYDHRRAAAETLEVLLEGGSQPSRLSSPSSPSRPSGLPASPAPPALPALPAHD